MSATEDLNKNVQQAAEDAAKAAQQAYDTYKHLINVKAVATNGRLGALSAADTLANAPVGDAAKLRSNIGAASSADIESRVASRENVVGLGMGNGDKEWPYVLLADGTSQLLATRQYVQGRSLEQSPVGTSWKVRQNIGLGNDDAGRANIGAVGARESVVGVGLGGDSPDWPYFLRNNGSSVPLVSRAVLEATRNPNVVGCTVTLMMKNWGNLGPGSTCTGSDIANWGGPSILDGNWKQLGIQWVTEIGKAIITYVKVG